MPPPTRLTPSQRVFGVGVTPTYDIFRPPEGMELDPAYSPVTRRQQAAVMDADLQREAFADQRAQTQRQRDIQAEEDAAIEAMRGRKPEEFGEILSQFPGTARSKNLPSMLNYAQAVQPSAGQKTLAPSLRNRLKPHERQYFDEHFTQGGDAVSAFDAAQMRGEHENSLADMMQKGVPLDVIEKYRSRPLNPIEREALVQQHAVKATKDDHRSEAMRDAIKAAYESMPVVGDVDPVTNKPFTIDEILQARSEVANKAYRSFYPEKFQQAPVAPQAGAPTTPAAQPDAATAPAFEQPAIQNVDLSKIPYSQREQYVKDLENQAKEGEEINKAWFNAQKDLQSKLEKEIGTGNIGNTNYSKLRSFAEAVLADETTPTGELGTGGEYRMDVPVGFEVLKKIGLKPSQAAFSEPGNRRTGTQNVTYEDLLKTWAKNYLGTAPVTVVPQVPALPPQKAQAVDSVLDSLLKPSNG